MSTTYPVWPLTSYPDTLDKDNSSIRQNIVNFEDRTSSTDPQLYYVLANDVRSLQQAVFSVQETLGVIPQTTYGTVSARIAALEDYTDLDARYGGATWGSIAPASRPTIMGHLHNGSSTGAPKINLSGHVTGILGRANINLVRTDASGLTGDNIAVSATADQTISSKFNDKLDKTGGVIQGTGAYLTVNGSFNSRIYKEADAYLCIPTSSGIGANVADSGAFSGTARRALSTNAAGYVASYTSQLRYGDYSLGIRARVSNVAPLQRIAQIRVYSGTTLVKTLDVTPSMFTNTEYQMIYAAFTHKGSWNVTVNIYWYGTSTVPAIASDLTIDGIIITPIHLTTYDID